MDDLTQSIKRLNAIADAGLTYGKDEFDRERYLEVKKILSVLTETSSALTKSEIADLLRPTDWYPTPLVDVRAFVPNDQGQVLFVRDKLSGDWTLPGGYAEIGLTPEQNVLKELQEEAGVTAEIVRLLAIFDTDKWQPQGKQYYKFVFECRSISGHFSANIETAETCYFLLSVLTELNLSEKRMTKAQLELLIQCVENQTQYID